MHPPTHGLGRHRGLLHLLCVAATLWRRADSAESTARARSSTRTAGGARHGACPGPAWLDASSLWAGRAWPVSTARAGSPPRQRGLVSAAGVQADLARLPGTALARRPWHLGGPRQRSARRVAVVGGALSAQLASRLTWHASLAPRWQGVQGGVPGGPGKQLR